MKKHPKIPPNSEWFFKSGGPGCEYVGMGWDAIKDGAYCIRIDEESLQYGYCSPNNDHKRIIACVAECGWRDELNRLNYTDTGPEESHEWYRQVKEAEKQIDLWWAWANA